MSLRSRCPVANTKSTLRRDQALPRPISKSVRSHEGCVVEHAISDRSEVVEIGRHLESRRVPGQGPTRPTCRSRVITTAGYRLGRITNLATPA